MSVGTAIPQNVNVKAFPHTRTVRTPWLLGLILFVFLFTPTIKVLPINSEAINRPINDLLDIALVGFWVVLSILHWPKTIIRTRWVALCLWLLPISYMISTASYAVVNFQLDIKQIYILIFSLRPLALTSVVIWLCRWYKLSLASCHRALRMIVWIVALNVVYVSVLALLQIQQISAGQEFIYQFYRYDQWNPEIVYEAVTRYGRATSIFHWPNSLSVFLVVSLFLLITYAESSARRLWLWLPILFGVGGVVLAGSRTGLAILAFGFAVIAIYHRRFTLLFWLGVGAFTIAAGIGFLQSNTGQDSRLYELFDWIRGVGPIPRTFQLRTFNWVEAISFYANQATVWTGITIIGKRAGTLQVDSFDSEYLVYFVWNGLIGFLSFLLFQFGLFAYGARLVLLRTRIPVVNKLALFILLISMSFPLVAISQEVWSQQRLIHLICVCLGLLIYSRKLSLGATAELRMNTAK